MQHTPEPVQDLFADAAASILWAYLQARQGQREVVFNIDDSVTLEFLSPTRLLFCSGNSCRIGILHNDRLIWID